MFGRTLRTFLVAGGCTVVLALPNQARAQGNGNPPSNPAIGESYNVELAGSLWMPSQSGIITSEQFGIAGSDIDFATDLGFKDKNFYDARVVLRAGRKHRFKFQYTPISYSADSTLSRDVVFNGIKYTVDLPVQSAFDWKVFRVGYEYDFIYTDRGFLGFLIEARFTNMNARLTSALNDEHTSAKAPLPSFGLVGRVYPIRNFSITAEASGFKLPDFSDDYEADYFDIDVYGTFNITDNLGVQGGYRRITTFLRVETDTGDLRFQGIWFGGVFRFFDKR